MQTNKADWLDVWPKLLYGFNGRWDGGLVQRKPKAEIPSKGFACFEVLEHKWRNRTNQLEHKRRTVIPMLNIYSYATCAPREKYYYAVIVL